MFFYLFNVTLTGLLYFCLQPIDYLCVVDSIINKCKSLEIKGRTVLVSRCGRVFSFKTKREYSYNTTNSGYVTVGFELVHRIVATAYCETDSADKTYVNHVNYIKTDNHYTNLEWVTAEQNLRHASFLRQSGIWTHKLLERKINKAWRKVYSRYALSERMKINNPNKGGVSESHRENMSKAQRKMCVDLETGLFFDSFMSACNALNLNYGTEGSRRFYNKYCRIVEL